MFISKESEDAPKKYFNDSNIYYWLVKLLEAEPTARKNFGWLTSKIHDALIDEPIPSRSDVKTICGFLFEWVECFSEEIEVTQHQYTKSLHLIKKQIDNK